MKKLLLLLSLLFLSGCSNQIGATRTFVSEQVGESPVAGRILQTNGATSTWVATSSLGIVGGSGSGSSTPGGSDTQVQFNDGGAFGGDSGFTFNSSTNQLSVTNVTSTAITSTILYASSAVGIGTTPNASSYALDIEMGSRDVRFKGSSIFGNGFITENSTSNQLWALGTAGTSGILGPQGAFYFYDNTSSFLSLVLTKTGLLGLGVTSPGSRVSLAASTTATGGIAFGTDTNLYRSAANVLTTDDSLIISGNATSTNFNATGLSFTNGNGTSITTTNLYAVTSTLGNAMVTSGLSFLAGSGASIYLNGGNLYLTSGGANIQSGGGDIIALVGESAFNAGLDLGSLSQSQTFTFPDNTGTFALTSDLALYLPLTGGTLSGGLDFINATSTGYFVSATTTVTGGFFQTGMLDCDDPTTSKLLYDVTTGKYSCGTDQTGGGSGGGSNWQVDGNGDLTPTTTIDIALPAGLTITGHTQFTTATGTSVTTTNLGLNGFSNGSLLFTTSSGRITQDNSNLFWDDANNRLGIGTTTPLNPIHVSVNQNSNTTIRVSNLIAGTAAQADFRAYNSTGDFFSLGIYSASTNAYGALTARSGFNYSSGNGGLVLMADNSVGTIRFATGGNTERMRIAANGLVGIGESSPTARLHLTASTTASGGLLFGTDTNLYRSAANSLQTDDHFYAASTTIAGGFFQTDLPDCDADNQTVAYDVTTGKFGCGDDDSGGTASVSLTNTLIAFGDENNQITSSSFFSFTTSTGVLSVQSVSSTNVTTTNLLVSGTLSLPANSITDAMVAGSLTITGGSIDGTPIGIATPSTAVFTNVTSTNFFSTGLQFTNLNGTNATSSRLFATNALFTNATSTNLNVSGLTNLAGTTITNGTSTNFFSTGLSFTNLSGTNATTTNFRASGLTSLVNATSTNLGVTGITGLQTLTFTSATGTNLSMSGITSLAGLTFTNATGTNFSLTGSFTQSGLLDCDTNSTTLKYDVTTGKFSCSSAINTVFHKATYGAYTGDVIDYGFMPATTTIRRCVGVVRCEGACTTAGYTLDVRHGSTPAASSTQSQLFTANISLTSTSTPVSFCPSGCTTAATFSNNVVSSTSALFVRVITASSTPTMTLNLQCEGTYN